MITALELAQSINIPHDYPWLRKYATQLGYTIADEELLSLAHEVPYWDWHQSSESEYHLCCHLYQDGMPVSLPELSDDEPF